MRKRWPRSILILVVAMLVLLVAVLRIPLQNALSERMEGALPPDGKAYYGVQLSWSDDTPAAYTSRLGKAPAVYGDYRNFPLSSADKLVLSKEVRQIVTTHGKLMVTLEPWEGLSKVTPQAAHDLAVTLASYHR